MSATAAAAPAQGAPSLAEIPAKPEHKVGQLTTGELAQERSRLEAALRRPFAESVKALLRARLDAVLAEQAERQRRREADTAAAKAELASQAAEDACQVRPGWNPLRSEIPIAKRR